MPVQIRVPVIAHDPDFQLVGATIRCEVVLQLRDRGIDGAQRLKHRRRALPVSMRVFVHAGMRDKRNPRTLRADARTRLLANPAVEA